MWPAPAKTAKKAENHSKEGPINATDSKSGVWDGYICIFSKLSHCECQIIVESKLQTFTIVFIINCYFVIRTISNFEAQVESILLGSGNSLYTEVLFSGALSELNIWGTSFSIEEILAITKSCKDVEFNYTSPDILKWSDVEGHFFSDDSRSLNMKEKCTLNF